jgi:hypothetical protein
MKISISNENGVFLAEIRGDSKIFGFEIDQGDEIVLIKGDKKLFINWDEKHVRFVVSPK